MTGEASAAALKAGHPEGVDPRPAWIAAVDGQEQYEWARVAWEAASAVPDAWFDHDLADQVVAQWPTWATLTVDRFSGRAFRLTTWQELVVRLLVGWQVPVEVLDPDTHEPIRLYVRLFRRLLLWIPRKNGKSEFLAALAILFFILDGVTEGEGYVFALKEDQARLVFSRMGAMIANRASLAREVIATAKSYYVKALRAAFVLLTGAERGLHGKGPTVIVGDEMHEWRSTTIADTLRQGTGGRLQPIELYASTAGRKSGGKSAGEGLYEESRSIVDRRTQKPRTLAVIFAANDNDDPFDEATWRKANPNLGLAPTIDFIREEAESARDNPRKLAEFKCYHLGIWADAVSKWLPLKKWDRCGRADWRELATVFRGRSCYAAFDVSSTTDITALVLLFPPEGDAEHWTIVCRFWIPEAKVDARAAEGAPIKDFLACGALETTPGDYVDQNVVGHALQEAVRDFEVELIGYDSWNAAKLVGDLQTLGGIPDSDAPPIEVERFVELRQGIRTLGEPSKHFERLVFEEAIEHGGHPVLRWMAANAVVQFDRNLNFMPAKDRSADKIDGIMASVMATACAILGDPVPTSPWEDPDFKLAKAA